MADACSSAFLLGWLPVTPATPEPGPLLLCSPDSWRIPRRVRVGHGRFNKFARLGSPSPTSVQEGFLPLSPAVRGHRGGGGGDGCQRPEFRSQGIQAVLRLDGVPGQCVCHSLLDGLPQLELAKLLAMIRHEDSVLCPDIIIHGCTLGGRKGYGRILFREPAVSTQCRVQILVAVDSDLFCELLGYCFPVLFVSSDQQDVWPCFLLQLRFRSCSACCSSRYYLVTRNTDRTRLGTTPGLVGFQSGKCCGTIVAIGRHLFLLLQICCILAQSERRSMVLDKMLMYITDGVLLMCQVKRSFREKAKFNLLRYGNRWICFDPMAVGSILLELIFRNALEAIAYCLHLASIHINGRVAFYFEHGLLLSFCSTMVHLFDEMHGEEAVPGVWVDPPAVDDNTSAVAPQFQQQGPLCLSSVWDISYLQLNASLPHVHTPDRPSREPPAGHQLAWSTEALGDCSCGIIGSELSTDGRSPFGSSCSLQFLCHVRSSPCTLLVRFLSRSFARSLEAMMYYDL